ncbi:MAG: hypothetical protein ACO3GP_02865 [Candidatus Limnocylindrus sp.]
MSGLVSSDPLALLSIEAGLIRPPLADAAAEGDSQLDSPQRAAILGEPVPIVFCRRDGAGNSGGVLISPPATEARFSNDASNAVTASYHLVLSEGLIGSIQVRDVFQRSCRVGTHTQTYDRRAGTWTPGNFITAQTGFTPPECPYYCGTVGVYTGMSTLSFTITIPNGFDQWNRQVHVYIRRGMYVTRLLDGVFGPSNNFADLVNWALVNCARLPDNQIDLTSLQAAAQFLEANNFNCDIAITESQNLGDLLASMAPYFLLAETRSEGRRGLRPLLPVNSDGTIRTTAVSWVATFTEDHILPDGFEITFAPPVDRRPFCCQTIWRQQLTDDVGIIRTSEVRYTGEAETGPYEQHDMSAFCTREDHAVKVGAYIRARRQFITHSARAQCRSVDFPPNLAPGDIVRVTLQRTPSNGAASEHDYLYQVDRISKTAAGDVSMDLMHFPVDSSGRSLVALAVANTTGTGILLTSNRSGVSCDVNSSADTTVPAEEYQIGIAADNEVQMTAPPEEATPPDGGGGSLDTVNLGFVSGGWDGLDLVFVLRITPLGKAPNLSQGDLEATVKSGQVIAYDANGVPVSPQPVSLPSVDVTETIAQPWTIGRPPEFLLYPFPPVDWIFEKEFRVTFQNSDFPSEGYYETTLEISSTSGGFDDVFAINTLRVRFEARTPTLTPFFSVVRNIENGPDAVTINFPGESPIALPRNPALDYTFEVNVYVWSSDTADKNTARDIVLDALMDLIPGLPSSWVVVNQVASLSSSPPTYGVGYVLELIDTEVSDGLSGLIFVGFTESPANLAQIEYGSQYPPTYDWTGTISWSEP